MCYEEEDSEETETELTYVCASLGGGFDNTAKLHAMNYKMAMKTVSKEKWDLSVEEE